MQKVEEHKHYQQHDLANGEDLNKINSLILGSLSDFRKERLVSILKSNNLDHTGEKDHLLQILQFALYNNQLDIEDVKCRILDWETWSRRHIYFFELEGELPTSKDILLNMPQEYQERVNRKRNFCVPGRRQVESIFLNDNTLKIYITESVATEIRDEGSDEYYDGIRKKIFRIVDIRKVFYFELNLKTGAAFISIPAAQTRGRYSKELELIMTMIERLLPSVSLKKIQIRKSITNVRLLTNVVNKGLDINLGGIKATFRAQNKNSLTDKNTPREIMKIINEGFLEEGVFEVGDMDLKAICSMRIYKDHRLGIFRDLEEEEYRYVCELVTEHSS